MATPTQYSPGYFNLALDHPEEILARAQRDLTGLEFDTIVGTGLSGTLAVPNLARGLGKDWIIVRKESSSHSSGLLVGSLGIRWLFVDDVISSGLTLKRVQEVIKKHDVQRRKWEDRPLARCVGAWVYEGSEPRLTLNATRGPLKLGYVWTR